jgi:hypothetical protein
MRLPAIAGSPPDPSAKPSGCPFRSRCPYAMPICATEPPVVRWLPGGDGDAGAGAVGDGAGLVDPAGIGDDSTRPPAERMAACHLLTPAEDRS